MKKIVALVGILFIASIGVYIFLKPQRTPAFISQTYHTMIVESPAFGHNQPIPEQYTCDGKGISPSVRIKNVPPRTQSLALIMDDPDALGRTFDHWVIWNIPPDVVGFDDGQTPQGVVGKNSAGGAAYFPPCPPLGQHRYVFTVYALDAMLDLSANSSKDDVIKAMNDHILDFGELIGLYQRKAQ